MGSRLYIIILAVASLAGGCAGKPTEAACDKELSESKPQGAYEHCLQQRSDQLSRMEAGRGPASDVSQKDREPRDLIRLRTDDENHR